MKKKKTLICDEIPSTHPQVAYNLNSDFKKWPSCHSSKSCDMNCWIYLAKRQRNILKKDKQGACSDLYAETRSAWWCAVPWRVLAPLSACSLTLKISFGPTLATTLKSSSLLRWGTSSLWVLVNEFYSAAVHTASILRRLSRTEHNRTLNHTLIRPGYHRHFPSQTCHTRAQTD